MSLLLCARAPSRLRPVTCQSFGHMTPAFCRSYIISLLHFITLGSLYMSFENIFLNGKLRLRDFCSSNKEEAGQQHRLVGAR